MQNLHDVSGPRVPPGHVPTVEAIVDITIDFFQKESSAFEQLTKRGPACYPEAWWPSSSDTNHAPNAKVQYPASPKHTAIHTQLHLATLPCLPTANGHTRGRCHSNLVVTQTFHPGAWPCHSGWVGGPQIRTTALGLFAMKPKAMRTPPRTAHDRDPHTTPLIPTPNPIREVPREVGTEGAGYLGR